jgi:hypothetical protein
LQPHVDVCANDFVVQAKRKRQEATFDEQMTALHNMRSNLTARKGMIERQIRDLDARMQEKQQKGIGGESNHNEGR